MLACYKSEKTGEIFESETKCIEAEMEAITVSKIPDFGTIEIRVVELTKPSDKKIIETYYRKIYGQNIHGQLYGPADEGIAGKYFLVFDGQDIESERFDEKFIHNFEEFMNKAKKSKE